MLRRGPVRLPLFGALAVGVAAGWNIANTGAASDSLASAYDVSLPRVGLLTTALFVTHFAAQIPSGSLIDRFGPRPVALAALALTGAGNVLALAHPSFSLALSGRLVMGIGTGAGFVAGSDWMRAAGGSLAAQGVYGGVSVGGGGLAIVIVPSLESQLDWRAPYLTALVVSALALLIVAVPVPLRRASRARVSLRSLLGDRSLYALAALHSASFGLSVIAGNWIVSLLTREGASRATAGAVGSSVLLGGLVTRPLAGLGARRHPGATARLLVWSMLVGGAATAVLATSAPLPVLAVAAAVAGLAAGAPFAPVFTAAQRLRPDTPAAAIGLVNSAATLTILVGTPLAGLTFLLPGEGKVGYLVMAVLWAAAALAVPAAAKVLRTDGP